MQIKEFFQLNDEDKSYWLSKIGESEWAAGKYLYKLLKNDEFLNLCGNKSKVFLLTAGNDLISFCTYSEKDDIPNTDLTPWLGFVFTFPSFRGKRRIGKLIEHVYKLAKKDGYKNLYISTDQEGLYENFGFTFFTKLKDYHNDTALVYKIDIENKDYTNIIGRTVKGKIDRPLGTCHPRHKEMIYPINYGYVENEFAADGAEQDVYVFGPTTPIDSYEGKVIAVYHRLNDVEDKWIVSIDGRDYPDEEILRMIEFQEQYFVGELCR